jgi:hypothetical protein
MAKGVVPHLVENFNNMKPLLCAFKQLFGLKKKIP